MTGETMVIPGTFDDYSRCSYDELCEEARRAIDGVVNSHALGARISEPVALALLKLLGMSDVDATDLLADARTEATQP